MKSVCFLLNNEFIWDTRVEREALALIQAGYDVTLICCQDAEQKLPKYEERDGIHIHRIIPKPFLSYRPVQALHFKVLFTIIQSYSKFDYIHTHDANMLLLGWCLSRFWRIRLIYDSHELWPSVYEYQHKTLQADFENNKKSLSKKQIKNLKWKMIWLRQTRQLEKWLLPQCDALIAVNDSITNILSERAARRIPKCVTVRNAHAYFHMDVESLPRRFHEHFSLPADTKILLYQGGLSEVRGIGQLLDALPLLRRENIALVLMGPFISSKYSKVPQERLDSSEVLKGKVFYKETVLGSELLEWTASADLGLAPILNVRESYYLCLPNKLFEYIQAGVPCGVSNFPEMQGLVDKYQVGFVFDPENPQEIAEGIDAFFDNPERLKQYRQNILKAKLELSWEQEKDQLLDLYAAL